MSDLTGVSVVLCTAPVDEAASLADRLLEARLVACANLVGPVESRYWWEGKIQSGRETLLVLKTETALVPRLTERIEEWHSYSVPEVLAFEAGSGLEAYLSWVRAECEPR